MTGDEKDTARRDEARALSRDELELSAAARYPALGEIADAALADLVARLRERRDRARSIADRQRREMRGKASPAGTGAARGDAGTRDKHGYLAAALRRARDEERRRRAGADGGVSQAELSRKALRLKRETGAGLPDIPEHRTADEGMQPNPNQEIAPSGALDAEGYKPVLERSRKVR